MLTNINRNVIMKLHREKRWSFFEGRKTAGKKKRKKLKKVVDM